MKPCFKGFCWGITNILPKPGLKPGRVIHVIRVKQDTFCPGQAGLTWIIKYPGLTQILHWITCVNNGICSQPK